MSEIHQTYAPSASTTNVSPTGSNTSTGNVPTASIQEPDNLNGSNTTVSANEGSFTVVQGKSVKGSFDKFNVINNPA